MNRPLRAYHVEVLFVFAGYTVLALATVRYAGALLAELNPRTVAVRGNVSGAPSRTISALRLLTLGLFGVAGGPVLVWPILLVRQFRLEGRGSLWLGEWLASLGFLLIVWWLVETFGWLPIGWPLEPTTLLVPWTAWCFIALGLVSAARLTSDRLRGMAGTTGHRLGLWACLMLASPFFIELGVDVWGAGQG